MTTLIIAEAGVNHNGDVELAKRLIVAAKSAGADVVKFQTFNPDRHLTRTADKAPYQKAVTDATESQYDMLSKLKLSKLEHETLLYECHRHGIEFCSTAFDAESFDMLVKLGLLRVKIPSGEITNLPYLRHVGACKKPLILSTGMASLGEIEAALDALETAGAARNAMTIVHCNTEYPTPMQDVNLLAMIRIRDAFGVAVGYSDHTVGIEVPIAAAALGATVIEKHLTLDRTLPGPDHKASLEPDEFAVMVRAIRNIEQAMGDGIKRPSPSEVKNKPIARKSLVAAGPIKAGDRFTPENLTAKRPGTGISPMRWDEVMGRTATRDYDADDLIDL